MILGKTGMFLSGENIPEVEPPIRYFLNSPVPPPPSQLVEAPAGKETTELITYPKIQS